MANRKVTRLSDGRRIHECGCIDVPDGRGLNKHRPFLLCRYHAYGRLA